ncbi:type II toxin-antitoxin system VapC family toxin [Allokutzneria sp. NRRL B-24872]|uniref:type II toxin-antitoxin system VapC family toxin n=1 Tax=Allokutzneria sp. NRRL B-24872 TaxID=1137961 RepID=UPI001AEFD6C4|nr:PIN domain-containing protein [Allokutzneria sp. NRRL B-24872]
MRSLAGHSSWALLLPEPLLSEIGYMLSTRGTRRAEGVQAEAGFLRDVAEGLYELVSLTAEDLNRVADLVERYSDLPLGTADASVVAVAERFGATTIATLDQRHFNVVRPRHVPAFTLLP